MNPILIILIKFLIIFILSLMFGLERQKSHKPVSFGAFIFVASGACGLGILAITINIDDPLPLLGAIVTGIGFLGAGALIKTTDKVFGFTTAAGIWVFAIIGLLIGTGKYLIGIVIYVLIWMVVLIDRYFETKGTGSYQKKITIIANKLIFNKNIETVLDPKKYKIINLDIDKINKKITIKLLLKGGKEDVNTIHPRLLHEEWVDSFKIE